VDIARYRATLQALTEARQTAVTTVLCSRADDAEREQWLWIVELLDSIERTARCALRETVIVDARRLRRCPGCGGIHDTWCVPIPASPREFNWQS
jgi:hypothetical protein